MVLRILSFYIVFSMVFSEATSMVSTPLFTAVDVDSVINLTFVAWDYVALEIKWHI